MKKDIKELQRKSVKELYKELNEARKKLLKLKLELAQAKLKNHQEVPRARKNIARILTIISEKQWEEFEKSQDKVNN